RLGHEILSTNVKIASIRQNVNKECHRYGAGTETLIHALKDFPTARAILTCGGLDDRLINNYECCIERAITLSKVFCISSKKWEKPLRGTVKLYAFEESLKLAGMMNITKATFETDYATLTNKIKKRKDDITLTGYRINECFRNMDRLYNVDVKWANRTCNKVADCLSKYVIYNESHSVFGVDYLTFIHKL
ncbi:hypothetical protein Gogos_020263, partial [Gossypium gossypioides]|nr:hypothetical protein [Gossypium gossypioides]